MSDETSNHLLDLLRRGDALVGKSKPVNSLASLLGAAKPISSNRFAANIISPPAVAPIITSTPGTVSWAKLMMNHFLKKKAEVITGRVLPGIDDLAVMEGRHIRAAFVYTDLHGFTKLVASQPTNKSFVFLNSFVSVATSMTKHYNGAVMDCAGDRILSVFHRTPSDLSNEPVEDAITFALWMQTLFHAAIMPAFAEVGLGDLSLGIGVDYGEAVVGCVGIRNGKRIVFFGDAANNAAKLQEMAGQGETVISSAADARRPKYLDNGTWNLRRERLGNGDAVLRLNQTVDSNEPPKVR
jgi:class 3 adenylate cyclase